MTTLQLTRDYARERTLHAEPRIPRWVRRILGIPLELKLLGANLIILGVAALVLFGPVHVEPGRMSSMSVVVGALAVGAVVNF
ncbi:MAG TPA: hypothetical protein VFK26_09250, partial [Gemmatimonadaceae bacterium]|nr:hypothetical protein [Gemmatimonadaceae bacterium]